MGLVERFRSWVARVFGPAPRCLLCDGIAPAPQTACPDCVVYSLECVGAPEGFIDPFADDDDTVPSGAPRGPDLDAALRDAADGPQDAPEARGGTSGAGELLGAVEAALGRATDGYDGPEA